MPAAPSTSMFVQGTMGQGQPGSCDQLEFLTANELSSYPGLRPSLDSGPVDGGRAGLSGNSVGLPTGTELGTSSTSTLPAREQQGQ